MRLLLLQQHGHGRIGSGCLAIGQAAHMKVGRLACESNKLDMKTDSLARHALHPVDPTGGRVGTNSSINL